MERWQILYTYTDRETVDSDGQKKPLVPFKYNRSDSLDRDTPLGRILMTDARVLFELIGLIRETYTQEDTDNTVGHWAELSITLIDETNKKRYTRSGLVNLNQKNITTEKPLPVFEWGGLYQMWDDQASNQETKLYSTIQKTIEAWLHYPLRKYLLGQRMDKNGFDVYAAAEKAGGWIKYETAYKREERDLIIDSIHKWLEFYGVTREQAEKIYKQSGNDYMRDFYRKPFWLKVTIAEIPFVAAYKVYCTMHMQPDGTEGSGSRDFYEQIPYADSVALRQEVTKRGSTYLTEEQYADWVEKVEKRTGHKIRRAPMHFNSTVETECTAIECYIADRGEGCTPLIKKELDIAYKIRKINRTRRPAEIDVREALRKAESETGIELGEEQASAFVKILSSKGGLHIVTGGPGTGKTQLVKTILAAWEKEYPEEEIALCAPTGRAAQRMAEVTGREASTIHRLLDFRPYQEQPTFNSIKPLPADLVIVDESSMIDVELFDYLICAVRPRATLILLGDSDQLESVGPGAVLRDLLDPENEIEKSRLVKVFRQAAESKIVENAGKIRNGIDSLTEGDDFLIYHSTEPGQTISMVRNLALKFSDRSDPYRVQILCPTRKGAAGINALNMDLQENLNGGSVGIRAGGREFRQGDKVLMNTNNAAEGYYNGDVGIIKAITPDEMEIEIRGERIRILREMWEDVELAYATTIHKSQGSEYETVVIVLPAEYPGMLARNLIYTAVTRARERVYIVYEEDALQKAVRTYKASDRQTMLAEFIKNDEWSYRFGVFHTGNAMASLLTAHIRDAGDTRGTELPFT